MSKKIISLVAVLLLLGMPSVVIADEAQPGSTTEWLEDVAEFDTDSYDVDGCFC